MALIDFIRSSVPAAAITPSAEQRHAPSSLDAVHRQLDGDYSEAARRWIGRLQWVGPERVPLDAIDYSNMRSWRAFRNERKVREFSDRIDNDWEKPIILVRRPGVTRLMVVDGHHRALAYLRLGRAPLAYVAHADRDEGPWDDFHDSQNEKART